MHNLISCLPGCKGSWYFGDGLAVGVGGRGYTAQFHVVLLPRTVIHTTVGSDVLFHIAAIDELDAILQHYQCTLV